MTRADELRIEGLASTIERDPSGLAIGVQMLRHHGVTIPCMTFWSLPRQEQWVVRSLRGLVELTSAHRASIC